MTTYKDWPPYLDLPKPKTKEAEKSYKDFLSQHFGIYIKNENKTIEVGLTYNGETIASDKTNI